MSKKQENSEKKTHEDERIEDKSKKEARGGFGRFFAKICIYITGIVVLAMYIYLILGALLFVADYYKSLMQIAIIVSCIAAILVKSKHPILLFVITLVIFLGVGFSQLGILLGFMFGSW